MCVCVCVLVTATARRGMLQIIYVCVWVCMQDSVHVALMCWCPRDCVCLKCIYRVFHCHLTFKLNDAEIQI